MKSLSNCWQASTCEFKSNLSLLTQSTVCWWRWVCTAHVKRNWESERTLCSCFLHSCQTSPKHTYDIRTTTTHTYNSNTQRRWLVGQKSKIMVMLRHILDHITLLKCVFVCVCSISVCLYYSLSACLSVSQLLPVSLTVYKPMWRFHPHIYYACVCLWMTICFFVCQCQYCTAHRGAL